MKITLRNDFHGTETSLYVKKYGACLSRTQMRRLHKTLCGSKDCTCSGYGPRGPQEVVLHLVQMAYHNGVGATYQIHKKAAEV